MNIIAIAGLSCSGKSTLANLLADRTGASVLALDDYYLPLQEYSLEERHRMNFDAPELYDFNLLRQDLEKLTQGESIETPVYDFVEFTRAPETRRLDPHPFLVIEGQYALFCPLINELTTSRIFLEVDPVECLNRRIHRDVVQRGRTRDEVQWRFMHHVLPMYEKHVYPTKLKSTQTLVNPEDPEAAFALAISAISHPPRASAVQM